MSFWQKINPKRAAKDFAGEWSQPSPHRWPVLGVAMAITFTMFWTLVPEDQRGFMPRPAVIYITSWDSHRTDEEIIASNLENQKRKDERAILIAARDERRKDLYRSLGRATGIDVEEIEADIKATEAADAKAAAGGEEASSPQPANTPPLASTPQADSAQ